MIHYFPEGKRYMGHLQTWQMTLWESVQQQDSKPIILRWLVVRGMRAFRFKFWEKAVSIRLYIDHRVWGEIQIYWDKSTSDSRICLLCILLLLLLVIIITVIVAIIVGGTGGSGFGIVCFEAMLKERETGKKILHPPRVSYSKRKVSSCKSMEHQSLGEAEEITGKAKRKKRDCSLENPQLACSQKTRRGEKSKSDSFSKTARTEVKR